MTTLLSQLRLALGKGSGTTVEDVMRCLGL
jgi:hypothetical protein